MRVCFVTYIQMLEEQDPCRYYRKGIDLAILNETNSQKIVHLKHLWTDERSNLFLNVLKAKI